MDWAAIASDLLEDQKAAVPDERRMFERTDLNGRPRARLITDRAGTRTVGLIKDISLTGVGMVLGVHVPAGQFVVFELEWRGRCQLALARVMHSTCISDGMYRVGAEFYDELPITSAGATVPEEWMHALPDVE